jgi:hypothetical protein
MSFRWPCWEPGWCVERLERFAIMSGLTPQSVDAIRPDFPRWVGYMRGAWRDSDPGLAADRRLACGQYGEQLIRQKAGFRGDSMPAVRASSSANVTAWAYPLANVASLACGNSSARQARARPVNGWPYGSAPEATALRSAASWSRTSRSSRGQRRYCPDERADRRDRLRLPAQEVGQQVLQPPRVLVRSCPPWPDSSARITGSRPVRRPGIAASACRWCKSGWAGRAGVSTGACRARCTSPGPADARFVA